MPQDNTKRSGPTAGEKSLPKEPPALPGKTQATGDLAAGSTADKPVTPPPLPAGQKPAASSTQPPPFALPAAPAPAPTGKSSPLAPPIAAPPARNAGPSPVAAPPPLRIPMSPASPASPTQSAPAAQSATAAKPATRPQPQPRSIELPNPNAPAEASRQPPASAMPSAAIPRPAPSPGPAAPPAGKAAAAMAGSDADSDADLAGESGRRTAKRRPAGPSRTHIAANDDLPSIGGLIFALHQKPSQRPMQIAAIASIGWILCGILLGWAMLAPEFQRAPTFLEMLTRPTAITLAATIILPIAVFWFVALLVWRAQELKLMSSAMTEVAIRLAEPDRMAEQQIASVGQAVRRQVHHMNEAVSRALGRAGELEALVHNEVASLERSYTQNENRIRGLLDELAGERNALLNTSERVNHSLRELGTDIPSLIDKLGDQQVKLARFIEQAGQNLVGLEQSLASSANHLTSSVGATAEQLRDVFENRAAEIANAINGGTARLEGALHGQAQSIERQLSGHTEAMQGVFDGFAGGLDAALGNRTDQMRQVIEATTEGLDRALEQRTTEMQRALEDRTAQVGRMIDGASERIDKALGERTEGLQTVLEEYTRALDATLEARQQNLDQQLVDRTKALDDAFSERLKLFDESILRATIAIDSTVADKARALSSALETHASEIAQVLGQQAGQMDEQIMHGVHAVRRASENVTKQSVKAIEGLAGQAELLRNLSENLVSQIANVTNRFDSQGQTIMRAANALESANQRIDSNLQQRQADLTRTLEDLSARAEDIDKVMRGYPAQLEGSVNEFESRARQAGEQIARSAEERSRLAQSEMEQLRSAAATESEQAVAELRSKFQNISREVSAEIGTLQSRFSESYDDIRNRARSTLADIEQEQARIRGELARLPEATRSSAESVRQSLQEQLRALEQLSQLSARETVRSDINRPTGSGNPPSRQQPAPPPRQISSVSQSLANEMAARTRPTGQSAASPAGDANRDGWKLGELLARASQDEGQSAPLDLQRYAGTLDQTTASAIWSRFRAGQRGVMVRSIYTTNGRATFDEVQQRYAADPAFQQAVDRYMRDMQRLLRDAEQRDATGRMSQGYIVSDQGRAYLFLAHATGQLA